MLRTNRLAVAALLAACSFAVAAPLPEAGGVAGQLPAAANVLLATYPGARVHMDGGRPRIFYGIPMTAGLTPREAAESWLMQHAAAFGAGPLELEERFASEVMNGRFTAFGYDQYIDGLPVEFGNVRVLVLNGPVPRVVYAAATVAPPLAPGQVRLNLDAETAQQIVRAMPLFRALPRWTAPELAVYQGDGEWTDPVLVWKFLGEDPAIGSQESKTFFIDATTGRLVHVRNEIYHNDVSGTIRAWATPGTFPDAAYNPPTLQTVPEMRVRVDGGPNVISTRDGLFTINNVGTSLINVGTGVGVAQGYGGPWVNVVPTGVAAVTSTLPVTPPSANVNFVLNEGPTEQMTAQVNVFIQTIRTHNYFKDRAPSFNGLDIAIRANTGVSGTCNAFFQPSGPSINFYNSGGGCPNTGYSSVVAHEYGHFIVNRLGLAQGGFGEGYSDVTSMMLYDDGLIGRGWSGQNTALRNPVGANIQYPCPSTAVHTCGQIVGGVWWRIRQNLGAAHGSQPGLEMTRDRQVAWSLITVGGIGTNSVNSAHPGTAIEVLTIDDDDGNIGNGTPNWDRICPAFAAHSISCPPLTLFEFQMPQGLPQETTPGQVFQFPVNLVPISGTPIPSTAQTFYRIGGGAFTSAPMTIISGNQLMAQLPAADCGQSIEFYLSAQAVGGAFVTEPAGAPASFHTARALAGAVQTVIADFGFETPAAGWTVTNHTSLTSGAWERAIPVGSLQNNVPAAPFNAGNGQWAYVTQNGLPGGGPGDADVDGGPTILTSPAFDLSGAPVAEISFLFWHYSVGGTLDQFFIDLSSNNGQSWVNAAVFNHGSGWRSHVIDVGRFIPLTSTVRVRFSVADNPNNSVTESGVDDVRVSTWTCVQACYANCDESVVPPILNVDDFTCFINRFAFGQTLPHEQQITHYANCDGSTVAPVLNIDDFTCYINAFALGCP